MIKLYDGQITDILPEKIADDVEVQCISYALQKEYQRIMDKADKTRTLAVIDELPEKILDVLAVELRTPYYQEGMDIEIKREIIKKTLLWHTKAGTPSAVEELIEIVFGEGKVVEWFDYEEAPFTPGTFDILTNARMTEDIASYFLSIIQRVKNTRSHIRRILIERQMEMQERVATAVVSSQNEKILNHKNTEVAPVQHQKIAVGAISTPSLKVTNSGENRAETISGKISGAAAVVSSPSRIIGNNTNPRTENVGAVLHTAAAVAIQESNCTIFNGNYAAAVSIGEKQKAVVGMVSHSNTII